MDHRNPGPTSALDGSLERPSLSRPRMLEGTPTSLETRASRRQAIRLGGFGLALFASAIAIGWGLESGRRWLATRDRYRCAFRDIELTPSPPPCIKRGREGLLEDVRNRAGFPHDLDVLAVDLTALRKAFAHHSPWVLEVKRVRRLYPNRISVELRYRVPVIEVVGTVPRPRLLALIDEEAVVLPFDDVERSEAGPLYRVEVTQIPRGLRTGLAWTTTANAPDLTQPDPLMREFARLAAFVKRRNADNPMEAIPLERLVYYDRIGLFLVASGNRWVRWRESVVSLPGATLADERKWALLQAWMKNQSWPGYPSYLYFGKDEVRLLAGVTKP
jgi:hypothetical protein